MRKVLVKSAMEAFTTTIVMTLLNIFITKLEPFFTVAFFIIFALIGFMLFLMIELSCINLEKSLTYPILLMIEGLILIELTGIIMTSWKTETENLTVLLLWNIVFVSMFVTTLIGTKKEIK